MYTAYPPCFEIASWTRCDLEFPLRWRQSRNPAWQQHRNRLAPTPERGFLLALQHSRVSTRKPWSPSFLSLLSSLSWVSPLSLSSPLSLLLPSLSLSPQLSLSFVSISIICSSLLQLSSLLFTTLIIIIVVVVFVVVVNSDVSSSWSLLFVLLLLAHVQLMDCKILRIKVNSNTVTLAKKGGWTDKWCRMASWHTRQTI